MSSRSFRVTQGELWSLAVYLTETVDGVTSPVPLTTPASMDLRASMSPTAPLVARLDSDPDTGEGSIVGDGLERAGLIFTLDTEAVPAGSYYYDAWARRVDDDQVPRLILSGKFTIAERVTDEIVADDTDEPVVP